MSVELRSAVVVSAVLALSGCAGRSLAVSPAEIPSLEAELERRPGDGSLVLRYAAALLASGDCARATSRAAEGSRLEPDNVLAPLILGACLEQSGELEAAVDVYRSFRDAYPDRRGSEALAGRELLARRALATQRARSALVRESELAQTPGDEGTVAVLPFVIVGGEEYEPLSRALAEMMISDLALLGRFQLVERVQLAALLNELSLGAGGRVDPETSARVGRLVRAGRIVQGVAEIPNLEVARLDASVVQEAGQPGQSSAEGPFQQLLVLEKQLVVAVAEQMGPELTAAEERLILENGTQSVTAFLAWANGLLEEERGNWAAAQNHYQSALRPDPDFQEANESLVSVTAAPVVSSSTVAEVTVVASAAADATSEAEAVAGVGALTPVASAVAGTVADIASLAGERVSAPAAATTAVEQIQTLNNTPAATVGNTASAILAVLRVLVIIP